MNDDYEVTDFDDEERESNYSEEFYDDYTYNTEHEIQNEQELA